MKQITLLGSTGSIGESALRVIDLHPDRFRVFALSANTSWEKLFEQCCRHKPVYVVMLDPICASKLSDKIKQQGLSTVVLTGTEGLFMITAHPDVDAVIAGIVGAAGLLPTLSAVEAGKQVLIANKEALVMSGELLIQAAKKANAVLLPLDSEHNALFQCMPAGYRAGTHPDGISRLILTASGGPFLDFTLAALAKITPEMACQHPNWKMGKKITVDCATLMNKGLEVIEAAYLFQCSLDEIEVVVHPQSIIHSLVEYQDGSLLAQLGVPDMRIPIANALAWPERIISGANRLSLIDVQQLTFYAPDLVRFPCLKLAFEAINLKKGAPTVLNASNEVAVQAFLNGALGFTEIPIVVAKSLAKYFDRAVDTIEAILELDQEVRVDAMANIMSMA